jgi:Ala-tRNA(Pro) deacylase
VLADDRGDLRYALAVIPGDRRVDLAAIEREFGRRLRMARGDEISLLFPGLPPSTLLPVADELQLETFVDQALVPLSEVYLETADPSRLVRIEGESFRSLLYAAWCGHISSLKS